MPGGERIEARQRIGTQKLEVAGGGAGVGPGGARAAADAAAVEVAMAATPSNRFGDFKAKHNFGNEIVFNANGLGKYAFAFIQD